MQYFPELQRKQRALLRRKPTSSAGRCSLCSYLQPTVLHFARDVMLDARVGYHRPSSLVETINGGLAGAWERLVNSKVYNLIAADCGS
jgi:hypothetical protein